MPDLSVIIPYVNEWPQIVFTLRAIAEELRDVDHEIICIDNQCKQVQDQRTVHAHRMAREYLLRAQLKFHEITPEDGEKMTWLTESLLSEELKDDKCHRRKEWKKVKQPDGSLKRELVEVENHLNVVAGGKFPRLKVVEYREKLSHWNAKNVGVQASSGQFLLFLDAHVMPSRYGLYDLYEHYKSHHSSLNGTMHLPLTYCILEDEPRLLYHLLDEREHGWVHYRFKNYRHPQADHPLNGDAPFEVPCMSWCGAMMTRELYDLMQGWPQIMGIYGGGENYANFVLAVMGKRHWIYPPGTLHHHGAQRGYHYEYLDLHRARMAAAYCFGGEEWAWKYMQNCDGDRSSLHQALRDAIDTCQERRKHIEAHTKIPIEDWLDQWKERRS